LGRPYGCNDAIEERAVGNGGQGRQECRPHENSLRHKESLDNNSTRPQAGMHDPRKSLPRRRRLTPQADSVES